MTATVYFAGGEDIDFALRVSPRAFVTTAGHYRSAWSRGAVSQNGNNTSVPPSAYDQSPAWPSSPSDFWFHSQIFFGAVGNSLNSPWLGFASPDGVWRIVFRGTGTNGQFKISSRNAAGTLTDLVTSASGAYSATLTQIDVHIVYGVSGGINVYFNGSSSAAVTVTGAKGRAVRLVRSAV